MAMAGTTRPALAFAIGLSLGILSCSDTDRPSESIKEPEVPVVAVAANGPTLGAVGAETAIVDRPAPSAAVIGTMRAGSIVARSAQPVGNDGCPGGWYGIYPRGFVCVGDTATLDLNHPTLQVMRTRPQLDQPLPYPYVRARQASKRYAWDRSRGAAVRELGPLPAKSGLAVIGSWSALMPDGQLQQLLMTPSGQFVQADAVQEVKSPAFGGAELNEEGPLPLAFVLKRGVRAWKVANGRAQKLGSLRPRSRVELTGKHRSLAGVKFWATNDDRFVRHQDVTLIPKRHVFPDFATGEQRWIDISVVTGAMVLYEGKRPVFATLVSVGPSRQCDGQPSGRHARCTQLGTFHVVGKRLTSNQPPDQAFAETMHIEDAPWVLELSSGQWLHGAYWHSRFGVPHGTGHIQASPIDARRVFHWATPELPDGWHSVQATGPKTIVVVRK